jgi:hypothetical protein
MIATCSLCNRVKAIATFNTGDDGKLLKICGQCAWAQKRKRRATKHTHTYTQKAQDVYACLLELTEGDKPFPSCRALCVAMGWKSPRSATWYLRKLEDKGVVLNRNGKRSVVKGVKDEG